MTRAGLLPIGIGSALWLYVGNWLAAKGMASLSETCYRNSSAGGGSAAAEAGFRLCQPLLAQDRNSEAATLCEEALRHDNGHARLWCALGAARRRLAEMDAARQAYERAIGLDPGYAQAWCNLGEWQMAKGEVPVALTMFEQALRLDPALLQALNNRVAALYELGRLDDAEMAAESAIEAYPDEAALYVNLGNVLLHTARARPAAKAFMRALECDPACPEAHMNLAMFYGEAARLGAVLEFIEHEIAAKGENAQRLASLAMAQHAKGDFFAAEATCERVLAMQPGNVPALVTLAACMGKRADHRGAIRLHERALAVAPQTPAIYSNVAFSATYLPEKSAEEILEYHREWARRFELPNAERAFCHPVVQEAERPLRIGYVSGDFFRHPVGFLLRDIACNHDRSRFCIHCYSMTHHADEITAAIRANSDSWIDALLLSDEELAEHIRQDRIDILIDLSGHTAYNRLPAFVRRPAPVQATWIGYFHSTGLESIDYFISDPYTSPAGCGQLFTEIPIWLPHSRFCYSPSDYMPAVASAPVCARQRITFGSFNRIEKLVDPVLAAWAEVLNGVPGSRLVLKSGGLENESVRNRLRRRFEACGLESERLELRGPSSHPEMLAQYADIDIALDPFPFNGGMTTLEALWMGVPVVTIAGNAVVSRQTVSALSNIGLADRLAFPDTDAYVKGAIALAEDHASVAELRGELRPRMAASPLCQPQQFARDLEALYRRMWQAWCCGQRLPSDL